MCFNSRPPTVQLRSFRPLSYPAFSSFLNGDVQMPSFGTQGRQNGNPPRPHTHTGEYEAFQSNSRSLLDIRVFLLSSQGGRVQITLERPRLSTILSPACSRSALFKARMDSAISVRRLLPENMVFLILANIYYRRS